MEVQFKNQMDIRIATSGQAATNSGTYEFTYQENGETITLPAQFIFTYAKEENTNNWSIIAHYSSTMPNTRHCE